jgi:hypothetical protein
VYTGASTINQTYVNPSMMTASVPEIVVPTNISGYGGGITSTQTTMGYTQPMATSGTIYGPPMGSTYGAGYGAGGYGATGYPAGYGAAGYGAGYQYPSTAYGNTGYTQAGYGQGGINPYTGLNN